ncbi:MAG: type II toxin-antitoxin system RelE/ParE family toxin [Nitrospira sp.]|nr:type II toxin-antitoxin system RelE/ParE family toxin [Nitrospira sp.]
MKVSELLHDGTVSVLHAFQKKSTSGRATPKHELDIITQRLRAAEQIPQGARS